MLCDNAVLVLDETDVDRSLHEPQRRLHRGVGVLEPLDVDHLAFDPLALHDERLLVLNYHDLGVLTLARQERTL